MFHCTCWNLSGKDRRRVLFSISVLRWFYVQRASFPFIFYKIVQKKTHFLKNIWPFLRLFILTNQMSLCTVFPLLPNTNTQIEIKTHEQAHSSIMFRLHKQHKHTHTHSHTLTQMNGSLYTVRTLRCRIVFCPLQPRAPSPPHKQQRHFYNYQWMQN